MGLFITEHKNLEKWEMTDRHEFNVPVIPVRHEVNKQVPRHFDDGPARYQRACHSGPSRGDETSPSTFIRRTGTEWSLRPFRSVTRGCLAQIVFKPRI